MSQSQSQNIILSYFESLATGIEAKLQAGPQETMARKKLALEIARLGVQLFSGNERVAWCGVLAPFDLLHAMGVTSCFAEFVGAMLASTGGAEPMLAAAEEDGYSTDCCSYHRSVAGATLQGVMPRPDFLIATSAPCTGGVAVLERLARHFDRELFVLTVPLGQTEADIEYLDGQLHAMVDFVSRHTGEQLDPQRLRRTMELTNQARALLLETYELARAVPSPARRRDLVNFALVISLLLGTETAVEVAQTYRDEFTRKVASGTAGVPGEQLRLMWLQNRIQFKHPLEQLLEEEHGAAVVVDELNDITWDPIDLDDPFRGIARRMLSITLCGPVKRRIQRLQHLARAFSVDGAINPCNWGCRQGTGARGLVERGLKEVDVPTLNLEVDCIDPRNFSLGQLTTRIEAFVETLQSRRAAAGR
jgi:benzoyl-CoA reductase/2-hydroxyglutaryl-CoA dehydratase subunit BcrC/BadD/HgdB